MTKAELIEILADEADVTRAEAGEILKLFFDKMADALAEGERVEIRGLCSFYIKRYDGYTGRNPKTGEKVSILPKKLPFFKCGKELKDRVDNSGTPDRPASLEDAAKEKGRFTPVHRKIQS
jgi:integration host factor subunit beta